MTLRQQSLLVIGGTLVAVFVILYITAQTILLRGFAAIEEQDTRQDVARVLDALSDDLAALSTNTRDYAGWDETYAFVADGNPDYVEANLADLTFVNLRLNVMAFVNLAGQIVFAKSFDLSEQKETPVPISLPEHLSGNSPLLNQPTTESSRTGIILLPAGPILLASRPILTSEYQGPIRGSLIFGRFLDRTEIERLAEITHLSIRVEPFGDAQLPPDFQTARAALAEANATFVQPLSEQSIAGYAVLKDVYNQPALLLRADQPRPIYAQGQTTSFYFIALLMAVGIVSGAVAHFLVERLVISREERRASEERYRAVVEQAVEGIFLFDAATKRVLEANVAFQNLLGYRADEIPTLTIYDIIAHDQESIDRNVERTLQQRRLAVGERRYRRKGGALVDVEVSANVISLRRRPVLCAVFRDITERKRAEAALRERFDELRTLHAASQALNADLDLAVVLNAVAEHFASALRVASCTILEWDETQNEIVTLLDHDPDPSLRVAVGRRFALAEFPYYPRIVASRRAAVFRRDDPLLDDSMRRELDDYRWQSLLVVPLISKNRVIGLVELGERNQARDFGAEEIQLAESLANQAAIALENARLFEAEQTRRAELGTLYDLARALADVTDFDTILPLVTRHAVETIRVTFARVGLVEDGVCRIRAAYPVRVLETDLRVGERLPLAALPSCARVAEQNIPTIIHSDHAGLTPAERQALFLDVARTICLVPLHLGTRALGLLMLGEARRVERETFTAEKLRLAQSIGDQAASALHRVELFAELERAYLQTVLALANAVDAKDTYTADHADRLAEMALAIGRELGMSPHELEDLRYGAMLHDIGKIGVPDGILKKPATLDADEWTRMRLHPEIGAQILAPVPRLAGAARIVRHHHERFDGKGYPDGLAGAALPLGARILTVVDAYSAIIDKRVYKEARSPEEAVAELKKHAGTQFDPRVVDTFLRLIERGFGEYLKAGAPITLLTIVAGIAWLSL